MEWMLIAWRRPEKAMGSCFLFDESLRASGHAIRRLIEHPVPSRRQIVSSIQKPFAKRVSALTTPKTLNSASPWLPGNRLFPSRLSGLISSITSLFFHQLKSQPCRKDTPIPNDTTTAHLYSLGRR
jgi:hypothetical protein